MCKLWLFSLPISYQYLKLKRRNKTEIIKCDFAHVINKKSISEELNFIKNSTATLAHHFESCGYLQCVLVCIWSKFHITVWFSLRSVTGNRKVSCSNIILDYILCIFITVYKLYYLWEHPTCSETALSTQRSSQTKPKC